jgi:hypothetical protein
MEACEVIWKIISIASAGWILKKGGEYILRDFKNGRNRIFRFLLRHHTNAPTAYGIAPTRQNPKRNFVMQY